MSFADYASRTQPLNYRPPRSERSYRIGDYVLYLSKDRIRSIVHIVHIGPTEFIGSFWHAGQVRHGVVGLVSRIESRTAADHSNLFQVR